MVSTALFNQIPSWSRTPPGSRLHWFKHSLRFASIQSDFQSLLVVFHRLQYNEEYFDMLRSLKTMYGSRLFLFKYLTFRFSGTLHVSFRGVNSMRCPISRKRALQ